MTGLFIGVKEIAGFLRIHPRTVYRCLKAGRLPMVQKDSLGRWVLREEDYLGSLKDAYQHYTNDPR
uniref:DNA-binding protein n=1 Tax=Desulfobacca acetoxidans TaxID=60893 RepID=A0A7C3UYM7_9BACT